MDIQYLTQEKFDELAKELETLKSDRRKEVAEHLEYAKKLGDLSENAEYHQAREEQAEVEDRIRHLEEILKNSSLISKGGAAAGIAAIGATVRLTRNGETGKSYVYTIVGSEEAAMTQGKVSNLSPLGSALLGRRLGEKVSVVTPKGTVDYVIEAIK